MADQEQDRILEHAYDGIQEYDNPMPGWWVIMFWVTIVFAIGYCAQCPRHRRRDRGRAHCRLRERDGRLPDGASGAGGA